VKAVSLALAGATQGVTPSEAPSVRTGAPPWLARMNAILGLYEFAGSADNPAILGMARACGGIIARTYKHDATPWCALTVNYCLVASGLPSDDSLWALDFARYGNRLNGAALGAIATKKRDGGGHVFLVVGRTKEGRLVGRGGNQGDMVCDEVFDPSVITAFTWPRIIRHRRKWDSPTCPSSRQPRKPGATSYSLRRRNSSCPPRASCRRRRPPRTSSPRACRPEAPQAALDFGSGSRRILSKQPG
jgi:uncharacterized protein (TIGR02594 family)